MLPFTFTPPITEACAISSDIVLLLSISIPSPSVYSVFVADKTPVLESIDKLLPFTFTPPRVALLAIGNE